MALSLTDVSDVSDVSVTSTIDTRRIVKGQYQTKKHRTSNSEGAILSK